MTFKETPLCFGAIVLCLLLTTMLCGANTDASEAGKSGNPHMPVTYRVLVEKKVGSQATEVACRLRVENRTGKLQFVSRPEEKDISLSVQGLNTRRYALSFEKREFESLAKREIPLRPTCAIEMKLGRIVPSGSKEGESVIPPGWPEVDPPSVSQWLDGINEHGFTYDLFDIEWQSATLKVKATGSNWNVSASIGVRGGDDWGNSEVLASFNMIMYFGKD